MAEKETVRKMFNEISNRYDFLNHFLSFGIDHWWRKKFVSVLSVKKPRIILDVATGTGDLAIALLALSPEKITGIDIASQMLEIGKKKIGKKSLNDKINFENGDAENIPFPDNFFDAVTVAFGVRNFENLEKGLSEMKRILKPGGTMQILEFSHPGSKPFKQIYQFYSRFIIPFVGKIISKNDQAYSYLPESVAKFPSGNDFLKIMEKIGMKNNSYISLTFGISSIYSGEKPGLPES
jgi:demethylmenaquinone methyltransferase / 2-methoxy-6-polyprenyl-1,4-benzoquinol methylase